MASVGAIVYIIIVINGVHAKRVKFMGKITEYHDLNTLRQAAESGCAVSTGIFPVLNSSLSLT